MRIDSSNAFHQFPSRSTFCFEDNILTRSGSTPGRMMPKMPESSLPCTVFQQAGRFLKLVCYSANECDTLGLQSVQAFFIPRREFFSNAQREAIGIHLTIHSQSYCCTTSILLRQVYNPKKRMHSKDFSLYCMRECHV